jgi:hypothetical protein
VDEQVHQETIQYGRKAAHHLDEQDQQLNLVLSKCEEELIGILEFAVPSHWRKAFDLRDYLPASDDKVRFISERDKSDNDPKSNTKTKFAKSEKSAPKSGQNSTMESGPKYCTHWLQERHP